MLSYEKALDLILHSTETLSSQEICLEKALGYYLGEDIYASASFPPFDRALMDGYAIRYRDLKKYAFFECKGRIAAGDVIKRQLGEGECLKIFTGANVPLGLDTVIPVEQTRLQGVRVEIERGIVKKGQCLGKRGESVPLGSKLLDKGQCLKSNHLALLASVGKCRVRVIRKPQVAILCTGSELIALDEKLSPGKIYDSNAVQLKGLLAGEGIEPCLVDKVIDTKFSLKRALKKGLKCDVLLVSGGVSAGDLDFVPECLRDCGVQAVFHKVKIKPGKPLFFGKKGKTIVFGLPGNPLSTFLDYQLFVKSALRKMLGDLSRGIVFKKGQVASEYQNTENLRDFFCPVKILRKQGVEYLKPFLWKNSGDVFSLAEADGFMRVNPRKRIISKHESVQFFYI